MPWQQNAGQSRGLPGQRDFRDIDPEPGGPVRRWPLGDERHSRGTVALVLPGGPLAAGLQVVGDDETGCALTLTLQPLEDAAGVDANPQLVARVTWGNGGAAHEAELDIGTGLVQTFWASALQVAYFNEDPAPLPGQDKGTVQVRGSISYLPHVFPDATRTRRSPALAAAAAAVFEVPAFAINVGAQSNPSSPITLELLSRTGAVLANIAVGTPFFQLPLINGTRRVRITNTGAVAIDLACVFGLAF